MSINGKKMLLERNSTFYFIFNKMLHESIQKSYEVIFLTTACIELPCYVRDMIN